jgi:arylsulfatase A-like enzyme
MHLQGIFMSRALPKALVVAVCAAIATLSVSAADKGRPNIVVLVADDWGYSDVGSFGSEISTPTIDQLAKEGVRFSDFHVAASCSPTRSMLMTGVDNHLNGVGNMP